MKKFLLIVAVLIVLVIGTLIAVPFLVPTETYKQQLTAQVEKATGRKLTVAGPLQLSILPSLAVEMTDVHFANAPGSDQPEMASLDRVEANLKLLPLLRGSVEVDRFVLVRPAIYLEITAGGRPNWQFTDQTAAGDGAAANGKAAGGEAAGLPITELKLGEIRIEDGQLTYADRRRGSVEKLESINMELDLPDIRSPLTANGSLGYKGETITLELGLANPYEVIQGGSSALELAVDAAPVKLGFDGQLANGAEPAATGPVELTVPSVRKLAAWLASPIEAPGEGLERLAITGQLAGSPSRVAFTDATIGLDQIEGKGEVTVDLAVATPAVTGRLELGAVDLNPYLPPEQAPAPTGEPAPQGPGGKAPAAAGWSDEPLQLPPIGGADVDFELTLQSLKVRDLKLDRTVLALDLHGTTLQATFKEFGLYGGKGSGLLTVATVDGQPKITKQVQLEGLQALPFLRDAAAFERLEGTASANLDVTTTGQSQRDLVEHLNGNGRVVFRDGAITGINIAAMVRNISTAFLDATAGEARKTDFAELSGSFTIANGIVSNNDMSLQAPVLRVDGAGTVDLPARRLDYRIEPKAAATLEGQGGKQEVAGLLVPVVVSGPWDQLSFKPDLRGVIDSALKDPAKLKEQVEQLGGKAPAQVKEQLKQLEDSLKAGGTEGLGKGLTGALGGKQPSKEGAQPTPEDAAKSLLKGLFQ